MAIEFVYAGARAQARLGMRLSPDDWRVLESARGLPQYLHSARATALSPAVRHFTPSSSAHAIERSLRHDWIDEVHQASRWLSEAWRASITWTATLSYMPAIAHLINDGQVLPWMADDPLLSELAVQDPDARRQAILDSAFGGLAQAGSDVEPPSWWLQQWQAKWPAEDAGLRDLVGLLERYLAAMQVHAFRSQPARNIRDEFDSRVARLLRRQRRQPAAVFCHLLLAAVDLWRLRSGLIRRALFGEIAAAGRS